MWHEYDYRCGICVGGGGGGGVANFQIQIVGRAVGKRQTKGAQPQTNNQNRQNEMRQKQSGQNVFSFVRRVDNGSLGSRQTDRPGQDADSGPKRMCARANVIRYTHTRTLTHACAAKVVRGNRNMKCS